MTESGHLTTYRYDHELDLTQGAEHLQLPESAPEGASNTAIASRPEEKSGGIALLARGLLTLLAVGCGSLGLWRMGTDLEWPMTLSFKTDFYSHWQVWIGAAAGAQYASWRLTRYARGTQG